MNHCYRLVWNDATQRYVPAPETARGRGKSRAAKALAPAALLLGALLALPAGAQVLPTGGEVVSGFLSAHISGPVPIFSPNLMRITQLQQKAILQWQSFNIADGHKVEFQQPNASAIALNRVAASGGVSQIDGQLVANGQVWLVNPNGVVFGKGSQVNVGGLVASTLGITDADFNADRKVFTRGAAQGGIINRGTITVANGGMLALLATKVENGDVEWPKGELHAPSGNVVLAGGDLITLDAGVDGRLKVGVDPATVRTLIDNKGVILVGNGQVEMTARGANALSGSVVSNSGLVQAGTLENRGGRILLVADTQHGEVRLNSGGLLEAQSGLVETSAAKVQVQAGAAVSTGFNMFGIPLAHGNWQVTANDLTVDTGTTFPGASSIAAGVLSDSLATTHVTLQTLGSPTGKGHIHVNAPVSWNHHTLALHAQGDINVNAAMTANGTAGLVMNYGGYRDGLLDIIPPTPAAAGSGVHLARTAQGFAGRVDFTGQDGTGASTNHLSINGDSYTIVNQLGSPGSARGQDLQGMNGKLSGKYALGADIDASATAAWNGGAGFAPVGGAAAPFTGTFDGLGHTITGLTMDRPTQIYVGLFGDALNATLRNVGLEGGSVRGKWHVGGLVGRTRAEGEGALAIISNVYTTGAVASDIGVGGGLAGANEAKEGGKASIVNTYSTGQIEGHSEVGGLVGKNIARAGGEASISASHASGQVSSFNTGAGGLVGSNSAEGGTATISGTHATGAVNGTYDVGGLVGKNFASSGQASILQSDATGAVVGSNDRVGGLVGHNQSDGDKARASISGSHATATVTGANGIGGLVGVNSAARRGTTSISNAEASGEVRGGNEVGGLVGTNQARTDGNASISDARATGLMVTGTGNRVGGLVGLSSDVTGGTASISDSDAAARVKGMDYVGGLVGQNTVTVTAPAVGQALISNSHATGSVAGASHVGGLVGANDASGGEARIVNSYATGQAADSEPAAMGVAGQNNVGGLVGSNTATGGGAASIEQSHASAIVTGTGGNVGGLVGDNSADFLGSATVTGSHASGRVQGTDNVGGLVGASSASSKGKVAIASSHATGAVHGRDRVGGLVGANSASVISSEASIANGSYATGAVQGRSNLGGLVGVNLADNFGKASVSDVQASGNVEVSGIYLSPGTATGYVDGAGTNIGGLIGWNNATGHGEARIAAATASGQVSGLGEVGGLVGANFAVLDGKAAISGATASGKVKATGHNAGGLVGANVADAAGIASILDANALGNVGGVNNVGGLVGSSQSIGTGTVSISGGKAIGTGQMVVGGGNHVGGLVGMNRVGNGGTASISGSVASAAVTGSQSVGGLVGTNETESSGTASISGSHATGAAEGQGDVGGLVGKSSAAANGKARLSDVYATGNVTGTGDRVGGLVGLNSAALGQAAITASHASGAVQGRDNVGGLVGANSASVGGEASIANNSYATGTVQGRANLGGLVGVNLASSFGTASVANVEASGEVGVSSIYLSLGSATGYVEGAGTNIGGLIGWNAATGSGEARISSANASGAVSGLSEVGGLVGANFALLKGKAKISDSHATGAVQARAQNAGGLVGTNGVLDGEAAVSNSYATGAVSGSDNIGGLVGNNVANGAGIASIEDGSASGTVGGVNHIGGLVGSNQTIDGGTARISGGTAEGPLVIGTGNHVGGLVGRNRVSNGGTASISGAAASAIVGGTDFVGGLVGTNEAVGSGTASISQSSTSATVFGSNQIGGLAGANQADGQGKAEISDVHATGGVDGVNHVGGLVGANRVGANDGDTADANANAQSMASISRAHATGAVSGVNDVGGLVGGNAVHNGGTASISAAYATGTRGVDGTSRVGGLVGSNRVKNSGMASVSLSYATVDVEGFEAVGGLVGVNLAEKSPAGSSAQARIDVSYASGQVNGLTQVGGLVGHHSAGDGATAAIVHAYATGKASSLLSEVGGLVGSGNATVDKSFYATTDAAGNAINNGTSSFGEGKTSADLKKLSTFAGWDIDDQGGTGKTWRIYEGSTAPLLRNFLQQVTLTTADSDVKGKTYDGSIASGGVRYVSDRPTASLSGALRYESASKNAGTYAVAGGTLAFKGLYSNQQGYDIKYVSGASLSIGKAQLEIVGTEVAGKTYDGNTVAQVKAGQLQGLVGNETLGVSASGEFASKDAGQRAAAVSYTLANNAASGGLVDNYVLSDTKAYQATIDRKALGIEGTVVAGKTYDGNTVAQVTAGQLQGLVGNETLGVSASGEFAIKDAGQRAASVAYTLADNAASGGLTTNYVFSDANAYQATIDRKALGIEGTVVAGKTYDGNNAAQVTAGRLQGLVGNETLGVSASGEFASKDAGQRAASVAYTLADNAASGGLTANYVFSDANAYQATIDRKALGIEGTVVAGKTYDGNNAAQVTAGRLQGLVGNETLGVSASGEFASKDAGQRAAAVAYTLADNAASGGLTANYVFSDANAYQATIDRKALGIEGTAVAGKTYDGNNAAQVTAGRLQGLVGNETLGVSASGEFASKDAGQRAAAVAYTLADNAASGGLTANYVFSDANAYQATIDRKALGIEGTVVGGKTYDGNATAQVTAGRLQGLVGNETLGVSASGEFASKDAGQRAATVAYTLANNADSGGLVDNYVLSDANAYQATIDRKALGIEGTVVAGKTYDGNNAAQVTAGRLQGLVGNETLGVSASGEFASKDAGQRAAAVAYTLADNAASGGLTANYVFSDANAYQATIDRKALGIEGTVVAGKTYDGNNAAQVTAGRLQGLVGNETLGVSASGEFASKDAGQRAAAVAYTLADNAASGGLTANYVFSDANAYQATIDRKALGIEGTAVAGKTYDGNNAAQVTAGQLQGLVGNETLGVGARAVFDSRNAGTQGVNVGYSLASGSGGGLADNYTLADTRHSATIGRAALTLATATDRRAFDGTTASSAAVQVAGLVAGDRITGLGQSFDSSDAGSRTLLLNPGYAVDDGNGGKNYAVAIATAAGRIDPRALTIRADGTTGELQVFDGTQSSGGTGRLQGEALRSAVQAIRNSAQTGAAGFEAGNYDIRYVTGPLNVDLAVSSTVAASQACSGRQSQQLSQECSLPQRADAARDLSARRPALTLAADFIRMP